MTLRQLQFRSMPRATWPIFVAGWVEGRERKWTKPDLVFLRRAFGIASSDRIPQLVSQARGPTGLYEWRHSSPDHWVGHLQIDPGSNLITCEQGLARSDRILSQTVSKLMGSGEVAHVCSDSALCVFDRNGELLRPACSLFKSVNE
jgi:hypothetical protein